MHDWGRGRARHRRGRRHRRAIARRFAREGFIALRHPTQRRPAAAARQAPHPRADGGRTQLRLRMRAREDEVVALGRGSDATSRPVEVAVFNIGANVRFGITRDHRARLRKVWG